MMQQLHSFILLCCYEEILEHLGKSILRVVGYGMSLTYIGSLGSFDFGPTLSNSLGSFVGSPEDPPVEKHHDQHWGVE